MIAFTITIGNVRILDIMRRGQQDLTPKAFRKLSELFEELSASADENLANLSDYTGLFHTKLLLIYILEFRHLFIELVLQLLDTFKRIKYNQ